MKSTATPIRQIAKRTWWLVLVVCLGSCTTGESPSSVSDQPVSGAAQTPQLDSQEPASIKVVSWNVLYGFNHGQSVDLAVDWLNQRQPDVVALQELNGFTASSLAALASRWGHPHSAILKPNGFPVGLTSKFPIDVIKRQVDGFHHGYLHGKTHQIHFFVVHFWPGKDHEAEQVATEIKALMEERQQVVLLGDFNSHSRRDADFLNDREQVAAQFNVVDGFEDIGLIDLVAKHDPQARFTFPSPLTIPRWSKTESELLTKRQRIDFIFADRQLAGTSTSSMVVTSEEVQQVSDHYPVIVEFKRSNRAAGNDGRKP